MSVLWQYIRNKMEFEECMHELIEFRKKLERSKSWKGLGEELMRLFITSALNLSNKNSSAFHSSHTIVNFNFLSAISLTR